MVSARRRSKAPLAGSPKSWSLTQNLPPPLLQEAKSFPWRNWIEAALKLPSKLSCSTICVKQSSVSAKASSPQAFQTLPKEVLRVPKLPKVFQKTPQSSTKFRKDPYNKDSLAGVKETVTFWFEHKKFYIIFWSSSLFPFNFLPTRPLKKGDWVWMRDHRARSQRGRKCVDKI